tara:strand:- start:106 stop:516 length:411 start_codon:yes stop_codon:yes gene_type:complete
MKFINNIFIIFLLFISNSFADDLKVGKFNYDLKYSSEDYNKFRENLIKDSDINSLVQKGFKITDKIIGKNTIFFLDNIQIENKKILEPEVKDFYIDDNDDMVTKVLKGKNKEPSFPIVVIFCEVDTVLKTTSCWCP